MEAEKKPTQMIIDQINLLTSEERKLKKFVDYNKDTSGMIADHLSEIDKKKRRLYHLCDLMGISKEEIDELTESRNYKIPQPTGRFGSALISHSEKI